MMRGVAFDQRSECGVEPGEVRPIAAWAAFGRGIVMRRGRQHLYDFAAVGTLILVDRHRRPSHEAEGRLHDDFRLG